jgi:thioredoxin-related protein
MRAFSLILACLVFAGLVVVTSAIINDMPVNAAQGPVQARIPATHAELIVFETKGCAYCFIFRRDVAPDYMRSPRAKDVPLRFIDVQQADISKMRLSGPLTMVPTIVLMQNGRETDRITGYMGPEPFFHMVSRLMP